MPAQSEEQLAAEAAEVRRLRDQDMMGYYGRALGLDDAVVRKAQVRGPGSVIDMAQSADQTGALGRALHMAQVVGGWIESQTAQGSPPSQMAIMRATEMAAGRSGVNPALALDIIGSALEVSQAALGRAHETYEGELIDGRHARQSADTEVA